MLAKRLKISLIYPKLKEIKSYTVCWKSFGNAHELSFVNNLVSGLFQFSKINAIVRDFRMPPNLADLDI